MQFKTLKVTDTGERLDTFLAKKLKLSRNQIQHLIKEDNIHLNDKTPRKTGVKLKKNDKIAYRLPEKTSTHKPEDIPLEIIFEDKNILVINKPAGIVVHPDNSGHSSGTILNAALAHCKNAKPVHRLDKDTSGVLLIAKNIKTHEKLSKLFKDRKVEKTYIALVKGHLKTKEGRIEAPIKRDSKNRQQMAINRLGKNAITTFKVLETYPKTSLLEVKIETGRTHQIRLHLASIGHPVIGDKKYGDPKSAFPRQFLHAKKLIIDGKTFSAKLPKMLKSPHTLLTTKHV